MKHTTNNAAYIDGANLHKGVLSLGWRLDYARLRVWLRDKYKIENAYLFIGLVPDRAPLYEYLQRCGYILIFKQIAYDGAGKVKGNCDADLVLHAVKDHYDGSAAKALLVSGDGDFAGLVSFLVERDACLGILAPDHKKCSILLKKTGVRITFINELRQRLGKKEKAPRAD